VANLHEVLLPDIGDFSGVTIIEILVAPGDRIEPEQSLLSLESDKATMEVPAPRGGVVKELKVAVGDKVSQGDLLLTLEAAEEGGAPGSVAAPESQPGPEREPSAAAPPAELAGGSTAPVAAPVAAGETAGTAGAGADTRTGTLEVRVPDIGDFSEVPVIEVLVRPGDKIAADQSLITLESDKATMEIPAPQAGEVAAVAVAVGDKLSRDDLVLTLRVPRAEAPAAAAEEPAPATGAAPSEPAPTAPAPGLTQGATQRRPPVVPRPQDMAAIAKGRKPHASPAVRRFARELGVDLTLLKGAGPKGRILKDDVQAYVKQTLARGAAPPTGAVLPFQLPAPPDIDHARFGAVEEVALSRIKKISGRRLHLNWISVPHVTQFDEADITDLEEFRRSFNDGAQTGGDGVKLTLLPILMKAVAKALERMPNLKASLTGDEERLVLKHYTHLGVAVDTPDGLVVPVVRDVDKKGIEALARELGVISAKARDGKLLPGDMQGGCFTISSLGGIGGTAFTPIVNAPEVAILGVSRGQTRPVWNGSEFVPRLMLPLSLSYDHRVVDGAEAVRFTTLLAELLGDIRRLLL